MKKTKKFPLGEPSKNDWSLKSGLADFDEASDFMDEMPWINAAYDDDEKDEAFQTPLEASTAPHYQELKVSSAAFKNNQEIPVKYTCDGKNISPPLDIENIPKEAECLAIIIDDPDAPISPWTHWLVWNIPVTHHIKQNKIHGTVGINDFEKNNYLGPCPPSGTHQYLFKVYALDCLLNIGPNIKKAKLEKAMSNHIIGFGALMGIYKRK